MGGWFDGDGKCMWLRGTVDGSGGVGGGRCRNRRLCRWTGAGLDSSTGSMVAEGKRLMAGYQRDNMVVVEL